MNIHTKTHEPVTDVITSTAGVSAGLAITMAATALTMATFIPTTASAQAISNNLSCTQAKKNYERNGQISMRSRSGRIVRIYGGFPARYNNRAICRGDTIQVPRFVIAADSRNCAVAYQCK